jgi:hypothetical protein
MGVQDNRNIGMGEYGDYKGSLIAEVVESVESVKTFQIVQS